MSAVGCRSLKNGLLSDVDERALALHALGECAGAPGLNFADDAARLHDMGGRLADELADVFLGNGYLLDFQQYTGAYVFGIVFCDAEHLVEGHFGGGDRGGGGCGDAKGRWLKRGHVMQGCGMRLGGPRSGTRDLQNMLG